MIHTTQPSISTVEKTCKLNEYGYNVYNAYLQKYGQNMMRISKRQLTQIRGSWLVPLTVRCEAHDRHWI